MVEVIATDEFTEWYGGLEWDDSDAVTKVVGLIESQGVKLGFPHSSQIKGASIALRELRVQSGGKPLRVFYLFDPKRQAVLLIGGDKTGEDRFYEVFIPKAEAIYAQYLREEAERDQAKQP